MTTDKKFQLDIAAIHNQWCRDNGYPVVERPTFTSAKLQATSHKQQATSYKLQAISQVKRQATSVVCGPNRQAPSKAFRDGR